MIEGRPSVFEAIDEAKRLGFDHVGGLDLTLSERQELTSKGFSFTVVEKHNLPVPKHSKLYKITWPK